MKKLFLLFATLFIIFYSLYKTEERPINGIMIDCSRLLEKHDYYYRLIDFMDEWEINTLLLHFSDDHGMSIALPGYEKLAHPKAFTPEQITELINYADKKGIEIIPELEVFGHTRFITDHPDYHDLYVGERSDKIIFNALDPLNSQSIELMRSMIGEVANLFPSKYLHLGCDEVNLSGLGLHDKNKEAEIWSNYVNTMIAITLENQKTPMIWSDHVRKDPGVADMLNKNVVLVEWNYDPKYNPSGLEELKSKGFKNIIMAPSVSCWRSRVIPTKPQLNNVDAHVGAVQNGVGDGLINTVWLPMRYVQNAMWYGMAYSAWRVNSNKETDLNLFHKTFTRKTFGMKFDDNIEYFLNNWIELHLDRRFYSAIANEDYAILNDPEKIEELINVRNLSANLLQNRIEITPTKNRDIFESMYLSAEIMYVLSEGLLYIADKGSTEKNGQQLSEQLNDVIRRVEKEWDKGRFPDDPAKYKAKFPNQTNSHLLILLIKLKQQIINLP